jgi:3-oxoacyl-[acyl-carrier-protein] synthase II
MNIYINSLACISPQHTFDDSIFLEPIAIYEKAYLVSIEPDYKEYIDARSSRRMGRILKMGVMAAHRCLDGTSVKVPEAIIAGTGFGCLEDTENFLSRIIENDEKFLTPTSFIQSTHNTISGQIALLLHCYNYNFTYAHRGFSFESALLDAFLLVKEETAANVLIGGIDEITPNFYTIIHRIGQLKKETINNLQLFKYDTPGSIAGEGAAFFLISPEKTTQTFCQLRAVTTIYKPNSSEEITTCIKDFVENAGLSMQDIDLVVLGLNGDYETDKIYHELIDGVFHGSQFASFKHLSGEYQTASGFALWLACKIVKHQHLPEVVRFGPKADKVKLKNVLIYNHYQSHNHSLMLISQC